MFCTRQNDADNAAVFVARTSLRPSHDVHHWLVLSFGNGQCLVNFFEEQLVGMRCASDNHHTWAHIATQAEHACAIGHQIESHCLHVFCLADGPHASNVRLIFRGPIALQGHHSAGSCLKVHVVGRTGSALRTIIEEEEVVHLGDHLHHVFVVLKNLLLAVVPKRNGEVPWQDGVGIEQEVIFLQHRNADLLGGPVHFAQEAGTTLNALRVHLRPCGDDAGGIKLHFKLIALHVQLLG